MVRFDVNVIEAAHAAVDRQCGVEQRQEKYCAGALAEGHICVDDGP